MNNLIHTLLSKRICIPICMLLAMLTFSLQVEGQEKPPRPISVRTLQGLNFGAFIHNGGSGKVIISPEGAQGSSGDIFLPNISSNNFHPARFEIDAEPGTLISIGESTATLSGTNGGTLTLELGKSDKGNPFIIPYTEQTFIISIGGILMVGDAGANPAGEYSGTFQVTFIQE